MSSFRVPLPALLLVPALVLLPVGRMLEIPLGLLAIAGFLFLLRSKHLLGASHAPVLLGLLASFTLPMLLSLPDAIAPQKSLFSTLGTLRYGLCCAA
ncbi:MAG: hypothetical protein NWQ45_06445, partial [Congregibacter sp.]|nr:hypothetical protein [Congregibacter sp.]